jgi:RING finger/CHY zinc finger protein 1
MAAVQLESVAAQHAKDKLNVEIFPQGPLVDGKDTSRVKGSSPDDYERLEKGLMQYGYAPLLALCYLIFI